MRICIIRGCGKPVSKVKAKDLPRWLCDEHYAPVSDEAIAAWIEKQAATFGRTRQQKFTGRRKPFVRE